MSTTTSTLIGMGSLALTAGGLALAVAMVQRLLPVHALPMATTGATAIGAAAKARMGASDPATPASDEESQVRIESPPASRRAEIAGGEARPSTAFADEEAWQFELAGYRLHLSGPKGTWHVLAPGATDWVNTEPGPRRVIFDVVENQPIARPMADPGSQA